MDVGVLLSSLADMLRRTVDQRIRIDVEVTPSCPTVLAGPGQLESVLLNIAINARDAMPDGGTLRFRAGPCDELPPEIHNEADAPSTAADAFEAIFITDTGAGMLEEVRDRAFEPFFTTKEIGRPTGLGLSTVYRFVKQARGAIVLESMSGTGTTLTLFIPQHQAAGATALDVASASDALPRGLNVLLVEDESELRAVVHNFLRTLGCRVTVASSAEQARLALRQAATFDLLLTDIALGAGMRGTELALCASQRFPPLAVLLMSGFSSDRLNADRYFPPSWELLRKPYSRGELAGTIARVIVPR